MAGWKDYFMSKKSRVILNDGIRELEERANEVSSLKRLIESQEVLIERYRDLEQAFDIKNKACEAQRDALYKIIANIRVLATKIESDDSMDSIKQQISLLLKVLSAFD